ncbi:MAG: hypothetical protein IJ856_01565 [Candidatus Methanomethylophilaceae archaeon]|nr:hypothetical protein [Candidatus Methanomethylophilaceae archaeon]
MPQEKIFIDLATCDLTLGEVMEEMARLQKENPDYEIFMDGDTYSIVGRKRE